MHAEQYEADTLALKCVSSMECMAGVAELVFAEALH